MRHTPRTLIIEYKLRFCSRYKTKFWWLSIRIELLHFYMNIMLYVLDKLESGIAVLKAGFIRYIPVQLEDTGFNI